MSEHHSSGCNRYYDTRAAAEYLGMSPKTLEKLRWQGGGPVFYKLGGVRYTKDDLDTWCRSRRRTSTSDMG